MSMVYYFLFQILLVAVELSGEDIFERAQVVIFDPSIIRV